MKKTINIGTTEWRAKSGEAILEVTTFSPDDPDHQDVPTLGYYKQRFGGTVAHLNHPAGKKSFDLDLNQWSHLPDETHLSFKWIFTPQHRLSHSKP
jgi:hypothetical protein